MPSNLTTASSRVIALLPAIIAVLGAVAMLLRATSDIIDAGKSAHSATKNLRGDWRASRPQPPTGFVGGDTLPDMQQHSSFTHDSNV